MPSAGRKTAGKKAADKKAAGKKTAGKKAAEKTAAEKKSAKKRARQEKQWVFPVVLLFCVLFALAGIVFALLRYGPRGFSDEEVDAYVHSIYGPSWSLQKKSGSRNPWNLQFPWEQGKDAVASYLYAGGEGGSFTVFTLAEHDMEDGVSTGRYHRALYNNYFSTVIENSRDAIRDLADRALDEDGPELVLEAQGNTSGAYGAHYVFRLYLTERDQLGAAADLTAQLDSLLAFTGGKGEEPWTQMRAQTPCVHVYLKPEKAGVAADAVSAAASKGTSPAEAALRTDWRSQDVRDNYRISTIRLTDKTSAGRLTTAGVFTRLENDYVDAGKTTGRQYYAVPDRLRDKYPAPVLTLVNAGGHDLPAADDTEGGYSYQLLYHRRTGTYWMTGLDPCEDFDDNPAGTYARRGAFADLVYYLGGSYTHGEWACSWRIGDTRWSAALQTQKTARSPYAFQSMQLVRDDSITPLDAVPDVFAATGATLSGRPYSIRDLIRMLDVRITINQKNMTAVMFRDIADE